MAMSKPDKLATLKKEIELVTSSTTVALLTSVVKAVVGSDIAGLGPDGIVSTETRTI